LATTSTLSTATITASIAAAIRCPRHASPPAGVRASSHARSRAGDSRRIASSSSSARIGTIVSQLRNDRLPLMISEPWNASITAQATSRALRGPNTSHGAPSSATWLNTTPAWWSTSGRRWNHGDSGFGSGCVSKCVSRHDSSRQHGSPRSLISPAPSMIRNASHRYSRIVTRGGGRDASGRGSSSGARNTARNPVSSSWISQPNPNHSWPTRAYDP